MAFGHPDFLRPYWSAQDLPDSAAAYYPSRYMNKLNDLELESAIRNLHTWVKNVKDPDSYQIVLGNGASQLISAALWATGTSSVFVPQPYYPRFPELIKRIKCNGMSTKRYTGRAIITAPNNPDGTFEFYDKHSTGLDETIVDACYNWPQYTTDIKELNDDLIVFSLAKATGHAGERLGWALVKDKNLAEKMTQEIELTTMGVSEAAMDTGRFVLKREGGLYRQDSENIFKFGKLELDNRWSAVNTLNRDKSLPFEVLNSNGMFLWAKGEIPDHVNGLKGSLFGATDDHFRLNMGCSRTSFFQFLDQYTD